MEAKMGGSVKKEEVEAWVDLSLRRFVYSSLAGAFAGFLVFRSPAARWASIAFGTGVGIGSAYTERYPLFDGSSTKLPPPKLPHTPPIQNVLDSD